MASATAQQIYATLLLSDTYLPGALVLAHSLRDAGTSKKLAVYYTADSVSSESISQLKTVFDHVLPVPRIRTEHPEKLYLMNRPDLESVFTKINLWTQTQFSKIVYVDADVVAYRAPDELFDIPHAFAAAPDIGWPDIFNTGVMVLTPDLGDYYALLAMAERGISFDGADQGLLNMYFKNSVHRLSFTYNVTPSGHYQYVPAYRHFQSSINMVHFIGPNKPWFEGRYASRGGSPYDEMVGRWWTVYDRHYRAQESKGSEQSSQYVQYFTKGEFQPAAPQPAYAQHQESHSLQAPTIHEPKPVVPDSTTAITGASEDHPSSTVPPIQLAQELKKPVEAQDDRRPSLTMQQSWDAQKQPPPVDSKPEAINFPSTHYEMSKDASPFVAPVRYPSPPKNMWYEVPKERPAAPRKIFPWEANQPAPSRAFPSVKLDTEPDDVHPPSDHAGDIFSKDAKASEELVTPTTPTIQITPSDPWSSFSRSNAWDEVPEINRYVEGLQSKQRRLSGANDSEPLENPTGNKVPGSPTLARRTKAKGLRLTDFPSETERPSLPVTPAPIRRPSFWGDDSQQPSQDESASISNNNNPAFPTAPGVPSQSEWDPSEQLERLAQQHSDELLRRLSGAGMEDDSEDPSAPQEGSSQSDTPTVLSPKPVKAEAATSGLVRKIVEAGDEEAKEPAQEGA